MYKPTWYTVGDTLEKIHSPVRVYLTGFDAQLRMLAVYTWPGVDSAFCCICLSVCLFVRALKQAAQLPQRDRARTLGQLKSCQLLLNCTKNAT